MLEVILAALVLTQLVLASAYIREYGSWDFNFIIRASLLILGTPVIGFFALNILL